jgi:hypothetical protein
MLPILVLLFVVSGMVRLVVLWIRALCRLWLLLWQWQLLLRMMVIMRGWRLVSKMIHGSSTIKMWVAVLQMVLWVMRVRMRIRVMPMVVVVLRLLRMVGVVHRPHPMGIAAMGDFFDGSRRGWIVALAVAGVSAF